MLWFDLARPKSGLTRQLLGMMVQTRRAMVLGSSWRKGPEV